VASNASRIKRKLKNWKCFVVPFCTRVFACFYIGNISLPTQDSINLNKTGRISLLLFLVVHTLIVVPKASDLLVLLVVVDLGVPEEGLRTVSAGRICVRNEKIAGFDVSPCHRLPRSSSWS
jgi:hypothetical protein